MDANVQFQRSSPLASRSRVRRGVSLLELLLALGLSVVVMALIAMSINLNFRMYDTKRTSIEEVKLARSVLRHIADDIRAAVQHMPPDLSGLETVIGNSTNAESALSGAGLGALAGAAGQGGNAAAGSSGQTGTQGANGVQSGQQGSGQNGTSGGGQNAGGQNITGGNGLPVTTSSTTSGVQAQTGEAGSIYGEEQAGGIIGLYGSSTELQIDISRLPRVDQFQAMTDPDNLAGVVDIPSDMKTVSYFLRPEEGQIAVAPEGRGRGLMRRVLDRSVSNYDQQNGGTGSLGQLDLMAEEVVGLQFMYFDGSSWTSDWDSASMEGLPVAIEITVILKSMEDQKAEIAGSIATTEEDNERLYTLTVNLPTAITYEDKQIAAEEKAAAEADKTALAQTGAIDTSGDAAAASGGGGLGGMGGIGGGQGGGGRPGRGPGRDGDNGGGPGRPGSGDNGPAGPGDGPGDDGSQGPGQGPGRGPGRSGSAGQGPGGGSPFGGGTRGGGGMRGGSNGGGRGGRRGR